MLFEKAKIVVPEWGWNKPNPRPPSPLLPVKSLKVTPDVEYGKPFAVDIEVAVTGPGWSELRAIDGVSEVTCSSTVDATVESFSHDRSTVTITVSTKAYPGVVRLGMLLDTTVQSRNKLPLRIGDVAVHIVPDGPAPEEAYEYPDHIIDDSVPVLVKNDQDKLVETLYASIPQGSSIVGLIWTSARYGAPITRGSLKLEQLKPPPDPESPIQPTLKAEPRVLGGGHGVALEFQNLVLRRRYRITGHLTDSENVTHPVRILVAADLSGK